MSQKSIYQEVILDHNRKPRNYGSLHSPTHHATGHNPLCGDRIDLDINMINGHIEEIAFRGESCAICKASSSMMTNAVKGKTSQEAESLIQEFREMLVNGEEKDLDHLGRLKVLAGVRDLPTRVKCAILPWHTLHAAMNSADSATTEADNHANELVANTH
ncbi:Fe-S cluster assembly sulfur transfer protein SufU [Nitrosomonas sp.]|uniref:Fe-S cluster assembly sulfur transfer protein SufU n=1 Tax=Nitrosomonas sp. TaxID=42353 RepID=UPI0025CEF9E8|nr:SUF system NifU family Fe-S cluster assembly protein [Nitrosomonas sp.]